MNDISEEKTKDCFLCDGITLFGSTLKDSFVLAVEYNYWDLHSLSDPIASIGGYKNQTRRSWRLCEHRKCPKTMILTWYDIQRTKNMNKTLINSHCSYRTSYALGISLHVLRPNTWNMPENQDYLSFRLRKSNRTGYLLKSQYFPHREFREK